MAIQQEPSDDKTISDNLIEKVLAIARDIKNRKGRIELLVKLGKELKEEQRLDLIEEVRREIGNLDNELDRVRFSINLMPLLPEKEKNQLAIDLINKVQTITEIDKKIELMIILSKELPDFFKASISLKALEELSELQDDHIKAKLLARIIPNLSEDLIEAAFNEVEKLPDANDKIDIFRKLLWEDDKRITKYLAKYLLTYLSIEGLEDKDRFFLRDSTHTKPLPIPLSDIEAEYLLKNIIQYGYNNQEDQLIEHRKMRDKLNEYLINLNLISEEKKSNKTKYDVLICYDNHDKAEVKRIANELSQRGINPWVGESNIKPGTSWEEEINKKVSEIKNIIVIAGKPENAPWENAYSRSLLVNSERKGTNIIPVILKSAKSNPDLPLFLRDRVAVDLREDDKNAMDRLVWGITGKKKEPKEIS